MSLLEELKEMRREAVSALEMQMAYVTAHQCNVDGWQFKIADLDTAIAALEPAPDISVNDIEPVSVTIEAPVQPDPLSAELRSDPGSEENAGTNSEEDISVYGTDVAFAEGVEARLQNIPIDCNPGEGVDATAWDAGWTEADTTITLHEQSDAELLAELDAPVSIVDDPELQAAVSRAEATLAAAEPAYVGLQDAQLDADYDAMRERENADKPKLHFSIFGERGNCKLEEV